MWEAYDGNFVEVSSNPNARSGLSSHLPTSAMVKAAIKALKERNLSSLPAIKKYIAANYDVPTVKTSVANVNFKWSDSEYKWDQNRDLKAKEPFFSSNLYFEEEESKVRSQVMDGIEFQLKINEKDSKLDPNTRKYGINDMMPAFYALDYDGLKSIADEVFNDKAEDSVAKANIYANMLGSVGTTSSALVIRDLAFEGRFDDARDAARALTGIPFHIRRPNRQLVEEFAKIVNGRLER